MSRIGAFLFRMWLDEGVGYRICPDKNGLGLYVSLWDKDLLEKSEKVEEAARKVLGTFKQAQDNGWKDDGEGFYYQIDVTKVGR